MELKTEITCPNCQKKFKQKIKDMRPGKSRICPFCKIEISFKGDDLSKMQKELDSLERSFKSISKKLKIEF